MEICGNCKHWICYALTGTCWCAFVKKDKAYFAEPCEHYEITHKKKTKENMETTNTTPQTKVCKSCGRELPLEQFAKSVKSTDGYQSMCRECMSARIKAKKVKGDKPEIKAKEDTRVYVTAEELKAEAKAEAQKRRIIVDEARLEDAKDVNENIEKAYDALIEHKLEPFADADLYGELKRRGWSGTLTRTETLK